MYFQNLIFKICYFIIYTKYEYGNDINRNSGIERKETKALGRAKQQLFFCFRGIAQL